MDKLKNKGFTIVELLIVIVVIGILAAITIVDYNGIQGRARAVALTTGIKQVDQAFRLLTIEQGQSTWPKDPTLVPGSNNPTLQDIITNTDLKNYLQQVPATPGLTTTWIYDNDGDSRALDACTTAWSGVNLVINPVPMSLLQEVDKALDDGNTSCGKIRVADGADKMIYQLGFTQDIQ